MKWHPSRKILAVGWETGEILIWNENDHELHGTSMHHRGSVNILMWNSSGSRLATADLVSISNKIHIIYIWVDMGAERENNGRLGSCPRISLGPCPLERRKTPFSKIG